MGPKNNYILYFYTKVYTVSYLMGGWLPVLLVLLFGAGEVGDVGGSSISSIFN